MLNGEQLWQLLRSLDDPHHLEYPPDYDRRHTRARFDQLAERIDRDFRCRCVLDHHVEDASLHGRIEIPAPATATEHALVISISNFGALAVLSIDNPGIWTDTEVTALIHPDDTSRIDAALAELGYTRIAEEPLWSTYDGAAASMIGSSQSTWWIRFFDYL